MDNNKTTFVPTLLDGYLDQQVYLDILKEHAKETITLIDYGNVNISNISTNLINQIQQTETEISPFHQHDIDCANTEKNTIREPSCAQFSNKKVAFSKIKSCLVQSFSTGESQRRPYPSAGALYPVEALVFLFSERITDFEPNESGCYHFRPISKTLQLIKKMPIDYFYDQLLHGALGKKQVPGFCILYITHIGKAIFKYRYRGYRHALMEAGSMYQTAALQAQEIGLQNTVWSTFGDYEIMSALDLDYGHYLPLTMQFFGYGES